MIKKSWIFPEVGCGPLFYLERVSVREEDIFRKWDRWLEVIYKDIQGVLINRHIFWEVQRIIDLNPKIQINSAFYSWMANVYAIAAVMGVRRQTDKSEDSVSLVNLINEIMDHPEIISRERYVSSYKSISHQTAHRHFDNIVGPGRQYINPQTIKDEIETLGEKADKIRKLANRRIAHRNKSDIKHLPTYAEIDDALDYIETLIRRYLLIFRSVTPLRILPVFTYDWMRIFRYPWIEKKAN